MNWELIYLDHDLSVRGVQAFMVREFMGEGESGGLQLNPLRKLQQLALP